MDISTKTYRYELDGSSKKFRCPSCGKKRFVRFVDAQTGTYMPQQYGRCDRENSCGYFEIPNGYSSTGTDWRTKPRQAKKKKPDVIPYEMFTASQAGYGANKFIQYLLTLFDKQVVTDLIKKYHIGSSKRWPGAVVFWQVDGKGNIPAGKVMLYDDSGHRVKKGDYSYIDWVHTILYGRGEDNEYILKQCLFGEHLLRKDKSAPVALVESEKTAIIASVYFPEFVWLAAGNKNNLNPEIGKPLMGRAVTLFPDSDAYTDWQGKAEQLSYFCDIQVSDLLQSNLDKESKDAGYDLADYLTRFDISRFKAIPNHAPQKDSPAERKYEAQKTTDSTTKLNKAGYPADWDNIGLDPLEKLKLRDPTVATLCHLFDAEPTENIILN